MQKYYMIIKPVKMAKVEGEATRFSDAPFGFMQYGRGDMTRDEMEEAKKFFLDNIFRWLDFTPTVGQDGNIVWVISTATDDQFMLYPADRFVVDRANERIFIERTPDFKSQQVVYYGDPVVCFRNYSQAFISGIHCRLPAVVTAEDMRMYARGCPMDSVVNYYIKEFEAHGSLVYHFRDSLWVYNRYDDRTAAEVALNKAWEAKNNGR